MKFIIKEVLKREVEAEDKDEVEEKYDNQEIVLDADDFDHVAIYPKGREERILDITTTFCKNECDYKNTCNEECVLRRIEKVINEDDAA
ncbi:MAG: DpnD/PcfM family protein [Anaeroplasma bactoclasticum]|nr:DpnD/PcfM family protein [Anaeroplasma bactoclasticum]